MKLYLIRFLIMVCLISTGYARANDLYNKYNVSVSGVKIGVFTWNLKLQGNKYSSEIYLNDSGMLSALYNFEGSYVSKGIFKDNVFKSESYKQRWETNKKIKIVEITFDQYPEKIYQQPVEKEAPRLEIDELFQYFDPVTSFINILSGGNEAKTIDGRRVYIMKNTNSSKDGKITIEISNYRNIWADHKRNDLKKIEFFNENDVFFPEKINIHFKKRVFKLKKI